MSPTQAKNLENRLNRLEKLVEVALRQDDSDWANNPRLVKKLDQLTRQKSIAAKDAGV